MDDTPTLDLAGGHRLTWSEFGDPDGPLVVLLHGTPGSRHQFALPDAPGLPAARIVCVDRPGYGGSTIDLAAMLDDTPQYVTALADHLGAETFFLFGVSGGAPTAIATATLAPHRVRGVAAVATAIPPHPDTLARERASDTASDASRGADQDPAAPDPTPDHPPSDVDPMSGPAVTSAPPAAESSDDAPDDDIAPPPRRFSSRIVRGCRMQVQLAKWWPSQAVRSMKRHVAPADAALMDTPEFRARFRRESRRPSRTAAEAILLDVDQCGEFWLLPLEDVTAPVTIWHGADDRTVPVERARELHAALASSTMRELPDEGHFIGVPHFGEILTALVG